MKIVSFISLLLLISLASAKEIKSECDVVATLFNTNICLSDIEEKNERVKNSASKERLFKRKQKALAYKIRSVGIEKLLKEDSYLPNQNEIEAFIKYKEKLDSDSEKWTRKIVNEIKFLLESYEYEEKNRIRLEQGLKTYEYSLKEKDRDIKWKQDFYKDIEKKGGKEVALKMKKQAEIRDKQRPIRFAKGMIKVWKLNRAIFNNFGGGKVVFHQFGPIEPIDAYRVLIENIKNEGKLKILEPSLQNTLLAPEDYYNKGLRITETLDTYPSPYWEETKNETKYIESLNHYKKIPHQ